MKFHITKLSIFLTLLSSASFAEDKFSFVASNGVSFDQDSRSARVKWAQEDNWSFRTFNVQFNLQGRRFGDDAVADTDQFVPNNTSFSFQVASGDSKTQVSCRLGDDPKGWIKRTALTDELVAATFEITFDYCIDGNTAARLEYDQLPLTVEGSFSVERKAW